MAVKVPRIAVLDQYDEPVCYLDNLPPDALHYYDETLHTILAGTGYTFTCKILADHPDSGFIQAGCRLCFQYDKQNYYGTIQKIEGDHKFLTVTMLFGTPELLNETKSDWKPLNYTAWKTGTYYAAGSFVQQKKKFYKCKTSHTSSNKIQPGNTGYWEPYTPGYTIDYYINGEKGEQQISIVYNELEGVKKYFEYSGVQSNLARIAKIAEDFGAELQYDLIIDKFHQLQNVELRIYKANDNHNHGIGNDQRGEILKVGTATGDHVLKTIHKDVDFTDIYTAVNPVGNDNLNLSPLAGKKEYDSNKKLEFYVSVNNIYAPQARDMYPATNKGNKGDCFILAHKTYQTDDVNELYRLAKADLIVNSKPKVSYEIEGYIHGDVGDTFTIADETGGVPQYFEARIVEQEIHFTEPQKNVTKLSNFQTLKSRITSRSMQQVQDLINKNKVYTGTVVSTNGVLLKEGQSTTLTAVVKDGKDIVTDEMDQIQWTKNGEFLATGQSITVNYEDIDSTEPIPDKDGKDVYEFVALDKDGNSRASYEVTVMAMKDGKDGRDAITVHIESTNGDQFKNTEIATALLVTIFIRDQMISNSDQMKTVFGPTSEIVWMCKQDGDSEATRIEPNDSRIKDNGFVLNIAASDVNRKAVFSCYFEY